MEADYIWLAGLLEGEASFVLETNPQGYKSPRMTLVMTDEDVVARAAMVLKQPYRPKNSPSMAGRKQQWQVRCQGKKAAALMARIYPQMGARRRAKFRELLAASSATCYAPLPEPGSERK